MFLCQFLLGVVFGGGRGGVGQWSVWEGLSLGAGVFVMLFALPFLSKFFIVLSWPSLVCVVASCILVFLSLPCWGPVQSFGSVDLLLGCPLSNGRCHLSLLVWPSIRPALFLGCTVSQLHFLCLLQFQPRRIPCALLVSLCVRCLVV